MDNTGIPALNRAIDFVGSQTALAAVVKRTPQAISEIVRKGNSVPAEWCIPIERATEGKVTRHDLRPDLYPVESPSSEAAA